MTKQRNRSGQFAKAEAVSTDALMEALNGIDLKMLIVKAVIGYVFAVTAFVAAGHMATTLALLVNTVWLQYVVQFIVMCALGYAVVMVTPHVTNTVYNAGAWVGAITRKYINAAKLSEKVAAARQRVSDIGRGFNNEEHAVH